MTGHDDDLGVAAATTAVLAAATAAVAAAALSPSVAVTNSNFGKRHRVVTP